MMNVHDAVASRHSVRDFLPTPVPGDVIRRVLQTAAHAPSGGNLQPWHLDVVAGDRLARLKALLGERIASGVREATEYDIYPPQLPAPYRDRRYELGEAMYARLGIPREDKLARLGWFMRNFEAFGAPLVVFCSVHRRLGPPQWSDLGMFLQTVMLLLRAEGWDSCAQESWSTFPRTVGEFLELPDDRMLFCGMAVGQANPDHPVNALRSSRAPLEAFVRFHDA